MAGVTNNRVALLSKKASSPPLVDWRRNCPGVNGKLKHVLCSGFLTDISFSVGIETDKAEVEVIRAHKFMLAMSSSVFEAMFMGCFSENSCYADGVIEVPDVHPLAFKTLLKFIYTGELDDELTTSHVLGTLYAAKKYDISELEAECTQCLKKQLSDFNAVSIFQAAQLFDEKELHDEALAFLKRNFDTVMLKDDFLNISLENLCSFLKDDDTFASELLIFEGVLRWAKSECLRKGISASNYNLRGAITTALPLIRFPVISSEDIALTVIPTGILTPEECTMLLQYKVVSPENRGRLPPLPFSDQKRSSSSYKALFFDEMKGKYVDLSAGWYNKFFVDKPISIVSFGFYGPYAVENASYSVCIKVMKDEPGDSDKSPVLAVVEYENIKAKMKEIFHVNFLHPVPVQPGIVYRAWFSIKGPLTCHGVSSSVSANPIEISVPVNTRYDHVTFDYSVIGANQLPEIIFQV